MAQWAFALSLVRSLLGSGLLRGGPGRLLGWFGVVVFVRSCGGRCSRAVWLMRMAQSGGSGSPWAAGLGGAAVPSARRGKMCHVRDKEVGQQPRGFGNPGGGNVERYAR